MVVRPAQQHEYEAVLDLVKRTFPPDDEAWQITSATIHADPAFRPDHLRVVERDGTIVGMINLIDRQVHLGSAVVRCAIIAPLATDPDYQGGGVGSALMRDMLEWARQHGFLLSMLWGHTWLYPRYGYAPGIKSYRVTLPSDTPPLGDRAYTLRPYTPADTSALQRVYHAETARATLAEVRSDAPWEWRPYAPSTTIEVAVDPARMIRGYMRFAPADGHVQVSEIYAMDAGAAHALFDRLIFVAREQQVGQIVATATPDNRWSRLALARGAQVCFGLGGGAGMVRVLDWPELLKAIQSELRRRVRRSEYAAQQAAVHLETPVGRATVQIDQGEVAIETQRVAQSVALPFHALGPLITGYQPIHDLRDLPGVHMYGTETERLLDVLFPEGYPHWSFAAYFS